MVIFEEALKKLKEDFKINNVFIEILLKIFYDIGYKEGQKVQKTIDL